MTDHHTGVKAAGTRTRALASLGKLKFWNVGGLFFFYFAIWQLTMTFLAPWLEREAGMSSANIGLVSTVIAAVSFCLQPFYGYIQDRLGFRKHLFAWVVLCAAFIGPFFAFVLLPVVQINEVLGAVLAGVYLSLVLNGGVGVVEAFNERNARADGFEYGHVRLFGSLAGATASFVGGIIWATNPDNVWWAGTFSAIVLGVLLFVLRTPKAGEAGAAAVGDDAVSGKDAKNTSGAIKGLLRDRSFVGFMILMFGTAALYDVFDQQFAIYFGQHVTGAGDPQVLFSEVVTVQILLEAAVMVATPFLINKIGAKWGLILFAAVLVVRVLGSAFIVDTEMLILWRLLAAIEMPLMLVSVWKYVTRMFDVSISATAYMVGFNMAKSAGVFLFSYLAGLGYDTIGFSNTYIIMGVVVIAVTVVASVLMRDDRGRPDPGLDGADAAGPAAVSSGAR
jgi:OHS family lactose permease-like MFS transporter